MTAVAQDLLPYASKELVRIVTMGSVDDGKSTLLGRLLYETGGLYDDQIAQVRRATRNGDEIDFSLFTDGLREEREQGITIDVAYRYLETPRKKLILADTPGHAQYTRNMATGASTADAGVILIDARLGLLPQGRRHAAIASLLGIPRLVVAVNKMDLVGFDPVRFRDVAEAVASFTRGLGFAAVEFVPVSARHGDNVAARSPRTPWYSGPTLVELLDSIRPAREDAEAPFRLPVQLVLRAPDGGRLFAGRIASGIVAVGDPVVVLPSGTRTRVRAIETFEGELPAAGAPLSVALRLEDEVDVARGDVLVPAGDVPQPRQDLEATAVWLSPRPLDPARAYLLKHAARTVPAQVTSVISRLDLETLEEVPAVALAVNDIGRIAVRCARPVVCDPYARNRGTGAFILIDKLTNETVAAGTVLPGPGRTPVAPQDAAQRAPVFLVEQPEDGAALALAHEIERLLWNEGHAVAVVRRAEAALACSEAGVVTLCAALRPELPLLKRAFEWAEVELVHLPASAAAAESAAHILARL